jgi:hypothetical protein
MFLRILEEEERAILRDIPLVKRLLTLMREYKEDRQI